MRKQTSSGFTIVETLIVLSVTGVMFVATSILVGSQIRRYQHRDAVYRLESTVRDLVDDVQAGYFSVVGASLPFPCTATSGAGTSTNCEIAGKHIVLGTDKMTVETLFMAPGNNPFDTSTVLANIPALQQEVVYPGSLKYTGVNTGFYVLYKNASGGSIFTGGAQSVVVLDAARNSVAQKLCFSDKTGRASVNFDANGSPVVTAVYDDGACTL